MISLVYVPTNSVRNQACWTYKFLRVETGLGVDHRLEASLWNILICWCKTILWLKNYKFANNHKILKTDHFCRFVSDIYLDIHMCWCICGSLGKPFIFIIFFFFTFLLQTFMKITHLNWNVFFFCTYLNHKWSYIILKEEISRSFHLGVHEHVDILTASVWLQPELIIRN